MTHPRTAALTTRTALGIILLSGIASQASAQDAWWTGPISNNWSNPDNWLDGTTPAADDHVHIGWPGHHDEFVWLNVDDEIGALTISQLSSFNSGYNTMIVHGDTNVIGIYGITPEGTENHDPAYLQLQGAPGEHFETHDLTLTNGFFNMWHNAHATVHGQLSVNQRSVIRAHGRIDLTGSGTTLVNDGEIVPYSSQSKGPLLFLQGSDGLYDLDGTSGMGQIKMNFYDSSEDKGTDLRFLGDALTDAFSSTIEMTTDSNLHMDLSAGWTADENSTISVRARADAPFDPAELRGAHFEMQGTLEVSGAKSRFNGLSQSTTLGTQARVNLINTGSAYFGNAFTDSVDIQGGTYMIDEGSELGFVAPTTVRGGEFTTFSDNANDGAARFLGETTWRGDVTFNGVASVEADARVNAATTITADRFVMDGAGAITSWEIENRLTIEARQLGIGAGNTFGGTIDIGNNFLSSLTMHTDSAQWSSFGEIILNGSIFSSVRIQGDRLLLGGDLTLDSGLAAIASDLTMITGSTMNLMSPDAELRTLGETTILPSADFTGAGTLVNAGAMTLRDGVSTNGIGIRNSGELRLGNDGIPGAEIGSVSVKSLESIDSIVVSLGGYAPGSEHDLLLVTGGETILGGDIVVEHADLGTGLFAPEIGDEFLVLASLSPIVGTFDNAPVSSADGLEYQWSVIHEANAVTLRLDAIVPSPGVASVFITGVLIAARRRRSHPTRTDQR